MVIPDKETGRKLWLFHLRVERPGFWMSRENLTFHMCVCVHVTVCHSMYAYIPLFNLFFIFACNLGIFSFNHFAFFLKYEVH